MKQRLSSLLVGVSAAIRARWKAASAVPSAAVTASRLVLVTVLAFACFDPAPVPAVAQSRATGSDFDLAAQNGISFDANTGVYRATGEVQLVVGDWVVLADGIEASLRENELSVSGHGQTGPDLSKITASGGVFVRNPQVTARCETLTLDPDRETVNLTGPGVVLQLEGSRLVTDGVLRFDARAGRFSLDGAFILQWDGLRLSAEAASGALDETRLALLEARGGAALEGTGWRAAAQTVRFDQAAAQVRLNGAAVVQQGDLMLSGTGLVYDLDTGSLMLDGGAGGRISGTLSGQP
ncbi:MAG: hypothetical protein EVA88_01920 [Rhodospirillaceae bacterium]|nr:MAG: hypothetical protein EVA88_01920 [Rhodospirillaceae bacterium]